MHLNKITFSGFTDGKNKNKKHVSHDKVLPQDQVPVTSVLRFTFVTCQLSQWQPVSIRILQSMR